MKKNLSLFCLSLCTSLFMSENGFALEGVGKGGFDLSPDIPHSTIEHNYCCEQGGQDSWSKKPCTSSQGTSVSNEACGKMKCFKNDDGVPELMSAGDGSGRAPLDDKMCQKIQGCCVSERECPDGSGFTSRDIKPGGDVFFWAQAQGPYGTCGQGWSFAESSKCDDTGKCVPSGKCLPMACPANKPAAAPTPTPLPKHTVSAAASSSASSSSSAVRSVTASSSASSSSSAVKSATASSSTSSSASAVAHSSASSISAGSR